MSAPFPDALLRRIWFYVNFDCNLACTYCVVDSGPRSRRPRLDEVAFAARVDEAVNLGFRQVAITGGEPLLHPQAVPMIGYAAARLDTVVLTNATLLHVPRLQALRCLPQHRVTVQVSLDAATPDLHDRLRGAGSWQRTVQGLQQLQQWGMRVAVRTTLAGQSADDLAVLTETLTNLGVGPEAHLAVPVVKGGRSQLGPDLAFHELAPELTVAADGLYWHPLKTDPALAIAGARESLAAGLSKLMGTPSREPLARSGYR